MEAAVTAAKTQILADIAAAAPALLLIVAGILGFKVIRGMMKSSS